MSDKDKDCDHKINVPDAGQPLVFFIIVTAIYGYLNYGSNCAPVDHDYLKQQEDIYKLNNGGATSLFIYILLLILGNYFININISKEVCGNIQWFQTFIITLLPWVLIFVTIVIILKMFPGWLSPFSNTVGYLIANACGLKTLVNNILRPQSSVYTDSSQEDSSTSSEDKSNLQLIQYNLTQIYGDQSLLINEITPDNFLIFWDRFNNAKLLNTKKIEEEQENNVFLKNELFNYIILKNTIAEVIWYLLSGLLVTSVGYNYIVNSSCKRSVKEMEATHNAYIKLQEQLDKKQSKLSTSYTVG